MMDSLLTHAMRVSIINHIISGMANRFPTLHRRLITFRANRQPFLCLSLDFPRLTVNSLEQRAIMSSVVVTLLNSRVASLATPRLARRGARTAT